MNLAHEDGLKRYEQVSREILRQLRAWSRQVPDVVDWSAEGLRALAGKPGLPLSVDGLPLVIAALCGPTGAGKSTVFRLLTGVDVPAGDVERPVTHSTCMAVPRKAAGLIEWERTFPEYALFEPLQKQEDLRCREARDVLYHAPYLSPPDARVCLLLADCPDFNSIDQENWQKAAHMMSRADTVVFVTDRFSYADAVTMEKLAGVCEVAGRLFFLLTRAERDEAGKVWRHLLARARELPFFGATRTDGKALHFFLGEADVFFSPYVRGAETPVLVSLSPDSSPLQDALHGEGGRAAVTASLRESARLGLRDVRAMCRAVDERAGQMRERLAQARNALTLELRLEGLYPFPLSALISFIMRIANDMRPLWLQRTLRPLSWLTLPARHLLGLVGQIRRTAVSGLSGRETALEVEKRSVRIILDKTIDSWRTVFPGRLAAAECAAVLEQFDKHELPPATGDWSGEIKRQVRDWLGDRRWMTYLGVLNDLLLVLGSAFVIVDVVSASISSLVLPGVLVQTSGLVLKLFEEISLGNVLRAAQSEWRAKRAAQLQQFVWAHVAGPLFAAADEETAARLEDAGMDRLEELCDQMEHILTLDGSFQ